MRGTKEVNPVQRARLADEEEEFADQEDAGRDLQAAGRVKSGLASPTETKAVGGVRLILNRDQVTAGSLLKGAVCIDGNCPEVADVAVTVTCFGTARLDSDDGKTYAAKHAYLRTQLNLAKVWAAAKRGEPSKTGYTIPFQYQVPAEAPPSLMGHYGCIKYECAAVVKFVPKLTRRRTRRMLFQVRSKSSDETCEQTTPNGEEMKISVTRRKRFSSFGVSDGYANLHVSVQDPKVQRGRTTLQVRVNVTNESTLHLRDMRLGIAQRIDWYAKGRLVCERRVVAEDLGMQNAFVLKPSESVTIEKTLPVLPEMLPPSIDLSRALADVKNLKDANAVCRVSYSLFAALVPPNFSGSCVAEIPLKVE